MNRNRFYFFGRNVMKAVVKLLFSVRCYGLERIPASGELILCCNHQSLWDSILLAVPCGRQIHYMAKSELFSQHGVLFEKLLHALGAFPVKRNQADLGAIRSALELLKGGEIVGIFPQGGCVHENVPFVSKSGTVRIAARSGAPILPAAIRFAGRIGPRRRVELRFGKAIEQSEYPKQNGSVDVQELNRLLIRRINELMEEKA
jgi:1-acyl-sn-glycerol-3-phosphate acyltransferase